MTNNSIPIDITVPLGANTPLYPGDSPARVQRLASIESGAPLTTSSLTLPCHVGTHVDAPAHFVAGAASIDQLDLSHFCGRAIVFESAARDCITADEVEKRSSAAGSHILIKTRNSGLLDGRRFTADYCYLAPEAAAHLAGLQPLSIGFDYYSLDPPSMEHFPSHQTIARAGIPVFVCLDLRAVPPGEYFFIAMPLKVSGLEAVPVRAVLFPL